MEHAGLMEITEHIDALAREGALLAAAGARADFDAAVPPCPEWHARATCSNTPARCTAGPRSSSASRSGTPRRSR